MKTVIDLLTLEEKQKVKIVNLKKEQILFNEDEECTSVGVVLEGRISISSFSYEGNEIVYNYLKEGEMFGNNLLFSDLPKYKGNVISKTKSKIALIYKKDLLDIIQNNRNFLTKYLEIQSNFGKNLNTKLKLLSFESARERFLYYLYINNNQIEYSSVTALASLLFMKRETLSRLISKLEKEQEIIRNNKYISKK